MVWLRRLDKDSSPLVAEDLPRPVLDAGRPVRLRLVEGEVQARLYPSNVYRIEDGNRWMDDPHTPKLVTAAGVERFRLAAKRWGHAVQHLMLFGGPREKDEVRRPEILHAVDYRFVRICALGTEQGKTRGYREALYAASRGGHAFRLTPPRDTADRAGDLSRRVLDALGAGEKQLCAALLRMLDIDTFETLKHRPMEKATVEDAAARLRSLAGARSVQLVFDLLSEEHRPDAEQRRIHRFVAPVVRAVFAEARSASHDPLLAAEAEDYLLGRIVSQFGNEAMQDNEDIPRLARASRAALHEIVSHLTPDDRATLRTMPLAEPPMAFWIHLATAPVNQSELPAATEVWKVVLRTVGTIRQAGTPAGAVLAQTGFPRARMSRLLTATGQALTGAIDEAGRWAHRPGRRQSGHGRSSRAGPRRCAVRCRCIGLGQAPDRARLRAHVAPVRGNRNFGKPPRQSNDAGGTPVFVQIHTLRDYSTALQNRGQDGLAKRSIYGGVTRQRISSQCIKAAVRDSEALVRTAEDGGLVPDTLADLARELGLGMSIRSALIGERKILPRLMEKGLDEEEGRDWANAMMTLWRSADAAEASGNVPLVIGEKECSAITEAVLALRDAGLEPDKRKGIRDLFEKETARRKTSDEVRGAIEALRAMKSHAGVDGALFGRFATGVAVNNVDSCVHVAHALTVHALASVSDFFSVRDQLKDEEEDRGREPHQHERTGERPVLWLRGDRSEPAARELRGARRAAGCVAGGLDGAGLRHGRTGSQAGIDGALRRIARVHRGDRTPPAALAHRSLREPGEAGHRQGAV